MNYGLKECPFCGAESFDIGTWVVDGKRKYYITCPDCFSFGPDDSSEDEAMVLWNQRATVDEGFDKIKGCPFCGKKKVVVNGGPYDFWMRCKKCNACGPLGDDEEDAKEIWDKRWDKE